MSLNTFRDNLRDDLKDLDSGDYAWTNDELDRHIMRAAKEYEGSWPLLAKADRAGDGATRRFDLSNEPGLLGCQRVEYEIDQNPPQYLAFFQDEDDYVLILGETVPQAGKDLRFWIATSYTLTSTTTSIPSEHQPGILGGAWGFAVQAFARYAERRVNARDEVPRGLREAAGAALNEFRDWLSRLRTTRMEQQATLDTLRTPAALMDEGNTGTPLATGPPVSWNDPDTVSSSDGGRRIA